MKTDPRVGTYVIGREPFLVTQGPHGLRAAFTGVPKEFAAPLVEQGDQFRWSGGEFDGAVISFAPGDPTPGGTVGGLIPFTRAADDMPLPGGRGLRLPQFEPSAEELAAYRRLRESMLSNPDGGAVAWELEWAKWRYIEWLSREGAAIFHGSNRLDIEEFRPERTSVEIMDQAGTGNLAAVYGSEKGLWAMWFAVMNRSRLKGSIQSGVGTWANEQGETADFYLFSVDRSIRDSDIWQTGMLYLFPIDRFERNRYIPGGPYSHEWASPTSVRPLKRIPIEPEDFPFLEAVGVHDDSDLIRAEDLGDVVTSKIRRAREVQGGMILDLTWDEELEEVIEEYLATRKIFNPDVELTFDKDPDKPVANLEVKAPPGYLQAYRHSLSEVGIGVED
ncbi:MAG TPA: hypothetical protein VIA81_08995 [Acidimicrobiia bacterium]|jgi:hypothetical protein